MTLTRFFRQVPARGEGMYPRGRRSRQGLATIYSTTLAKIPPFPNQPISVMQFPGLVRGFAYLQRRCTTAGNFVWMVTAEQSTISPFDLRRLSGG